MSILQVERFEKKYLISFEHAKILKSQLGILLDKDVHNYCESAYIVRSIYFDSINSDDWYSKMDGVEDRKKIRIRVYDDSPKWGKLEAKIKRGDAQKKISVCLPQNELEEILKKNYDILLKYCKDSQEAFFLYNELKQGLYSPVTIVEYDRTAFTYNINNIRITFDENVRYYEYGAELKRNGIIFLPVECENTILEVKYNNELIDFISTILQPYCVNRIAVSKYCMARPLFRDTF